MVFKKLFESFRLCFQGFMKIIPISPRQQANLTGIYLIQTLLRHRRNARQPEILTLLKKIEVCHVINMCSLV